MSSPRQVLQEGQVVLSAGQKPYGQRAVAKLATSALVLSMAFFAAPSMAQYAGKAQPYQKAHVQQDVDNRIPAEVVRVDKIKPDRYERQNEQLAQRSNNTIGRTVGALIGGVLGDRVEGRGRAAARNFGSITGAMTGNKLSEWQARRRDRQAQNNGEISASDESVLVVVDVRLPGRAAQRFEVVQSAAVGVRKGDQVFLMPTTDGGVTIVPMEPEQKYRLPKR